MAGVAYADVRCSSGNFGGADACLKAEWLVHGYDKGGSSAWNRQVGYLHEKMVLWFS